MTALLALMLAAAPASKPDADRPVAPIAVMPFKDLSGSQELSWLSVGIAETMMVDLKKGSHLQVVERDQLNHALAELQLQGLKASDDSNAAKVGKMVGARTVVLGSYQKVEKELRIVARFVDVETGVVKDAAKVTGKVEDVFELQDAIVVKLAGTPATDVVAKRKVKPQKTMNAYKLYAQSFTVMSDADHANMLQSALKEDPDFFYATEDLLDLQERIKRLSDAHEVAVTQQLETMRAKAKDKSLATQDRMTTAMQLIGQDMANRRVHACLRDTEWVLGSDLPEDDVYHLRQMAMFQRMNCYSQLKETSLAMQVGENFMKLYPGSLYFSGVQTMENMWISQRAQELEDDRTYEAALKLAESETDAERKRVGDKAQPHQKFSWAEKPCGVMESKKQHAAAVRCLQDMLDHRITGDDMLTQRYDGVRMRLIREATDAAEFEVARRTAEQFQKDEPDVAMRWNVNMVMLGLPTD
ncbi:MAG: hypothetical protein JST54_20380 [Deltaproteobacteria bacterium]|nr:hypothetical protein [Deltaproteobacteria bacterium]